MATEEESTNDQIIEFLSNKQYSTDVLEKVKLSKVSGDSISLFQKEDFLEMGVALADVYLLMETFSKEKKSEFARASLLKSFMLNSTRTSSTRNEKRVKIKNRSVTVSFVWYDFCYKDKRYKQMREASGGGRRTRVLCRTTGAEELLRIAKNFFFPKGKSARGKHLTLHHCHLADFSQKKIKVENFTLGSYIEECGISRSKLAFMTKEISFTDSIDTDSDSDFELPTFVPLQSTPQFSARPRKTPSDETLSQTRLLKAQQDDEFKKSLAADQEKDKESRRELSIMIEEKRDSFNKSGESTVRELRQEYSNLEKKEKLRNARLQRVEVEPELHEDCQLVSVKHCHLGKVQRLFRPTDHMQAVYDWLGSLSHEPPYFHLMQPLSVSAISLASFVRKFDRVQLQMIEVDSPLENASDESITFMGHHKDYDEIRSKLEEKRKEQEERLSPVVKTVCLRRESVCEQLMLIYQNDPALINHKIVIDFQDEQAAGDGLAREAYSMFLEQLLIKTFEGKNFFIPILQPEFSEDEYEVVGKILYHFFVLFGLFPIHLCHASMKYAIYGTYTNKELLTSFLSYIPEKESNIFSNCLYSNWFCSEEVVEVVANYGIRSNPTKANISDLISKIAKDVLITKCRTAFASICAQFKTIFCDLDSESIAAIYESATPTCKNVMEYINFPDPEDTFEQKAFSFLQRFVEEASSNSLQSLLRYVTGSSVILPGIRILVSSTNMNDLEARPIAKTCIKTLVIPRNMNTYHAFETKMAYYLYNKDLWSMQD